jgi:2-methylcitrate dehydratase
MTTTLAVRDEPATLTLARWASSLEFGDLDPNTIHQAKRFLLDSLGCALGGSTQEDVRIALDVLFETAGNGKATVIATGAKLDVVSAALANALMIRVLDYNDIYWQQDPCHPSDIIPAALAMAERGELSGRELLVGIILGHEIEMRLCEAAVPGIRERGWHHATLTAFASPIVAGRMLRLSAEQIQDAIGISGARHVTLGAVTAGKLTNMKNTVDPLATQSGVLAALLAERGFTGPAHVLDGKEGLMQVLGPAWKLEALTDDLGESWRIARCGMKAFPTEALTHTPISALLDIIEAHDIQPEQVERIHIRSLARAADILADASKYEPTSKETADHSLPYVIAAALVDRQVTPRQFEETRIADPRLRAQLRKVEVVADPEIERLFPQLQRTVVTVDMTDGRTFTRQLDYPKGDARNPLSDAEIEAKFEALATPVMSRTAQSRLIDMVWRLDSVADVTDLMNNTRRTSEREATWARRLSRKLRSSIWWKALIGRCARETCFPSDPGIC